jgi:GAF domain-containing protein
MPPAPIPPNEAQRLAALRSYDVLDTACEDSFDTIARLAARMTGSPMAFVSLLDGERQWFKASYGHDTRATPREDAFCAHAILEPSRPLVVADAMRDARFAENPLVLGAPFIRFYAGVPLVNPEGFALGTLCVIDRQPRRIADDTLDMLVGLARSVVTTLELRRAMRRLETMALSDPLTGLANRAALLGVLGEALGVRRRAPL